MSIRPVAAVAVAGTLPPAANEQSPATGGTRTRKREPQSQNNLFPYGEGRVTGQSLPRTANPGGQPGSAASMEAQRRLIHQLAREVRHLETAGRRQAGRVVSSGCPAMDRLLASHGYEPGSVVEYLRSGRACGATYFALAAAASAQAARDGYLVIVDRWRRLYPPQLLAHKIDLQRTIWVYPDSDRDAVWALDQALRTAAVSAVVAEVDGLDSRAARRLQLAAETGGGLGLLVRPAEVRRHPSWSEVQWLIRPDPTARGAVGMHRGRRLRAHLLRNRGGRSGAVATLQIDGLSGQIVASDQSATDRGNGNEQTGAVHLAAELARPKDIGRDAAAG
ncbi:MAG: hypothetical protein D6753_18790 [Planctomycetota bacterium]|nr:MAG: hypothetical protein D6753_18790 [Planctomycetota bacterium]